MLNNKQFREQIIQPALKNIGYYSQDAEELLVGICAHESKGGKYLVQTKGPALGIFQVEPDTYFHLWNHTIHERPSLSRKILDFMRAGDVPPQPYEMVYNLQYAAMMARIFFIRFPEPIPSDLEGQAALWKRRYNTIEGRGTVEQYIADYRAFVGANK